MLLVAGANIHLSSQNAPQRGHVSGGWRSILRSSAAKSRGVGEVAEAAAALRQRGDLAAGGSGEGGAGCGILHW